jgi:ABC-2 type transport system permease protein
MWLTWLFTVASLTTRRLAISALDRPAAMSVRTSASRVTPLLTSAQGANPLLTLTYLPLIIFSGGFGGLSGLPHWLNTLMSYLPAQPMIDAVTRALQPSASLPGRDLAVLAAWALGGLVLSVRFFRWDSSRPRHARTAGAGNPAPLPATA